MIRRELKQTDTRRPRLRRLRGSVAPHPLLLVALTATLAAMAGCSGTDGYDRECLSAVVQERTGFALDISPHCGQVCLPNGTCLDDGLTEDEAVLIALWNNAAFQELLYDLDIARGDLVQSGLLPNPEFVYYFAGDEKPYKYLFDFPLESLWLRPLKVAAARHAAGQTQARLTQAALDLIRDVRRAFADALLAQGLREVACQNARVREETSQFAATRLQAGDISEQEVATARLDASRAQQEVIRTGFEVPLAEERLRQLLGLGCDREPLSLITPGLVDCQGLSPAVLATEAVRTRPDMLAADARIAAAQKQLDLSRSNWFRVLGIYDATSGNTSHQPSPAFRFTVPIFNWNQGNVARVQAELDKAMAHRRTLRDQIVLDIRQAHLRYSQARAELELLDRQVLPEAAQSIRRAQQAYRNGDVAYLIVLESTRQLLDSRLRREQLLADLRQARADLERGAGCRLSACSSGTATQPTTQGDLP